MNSSPPFGEEDWELEELQTQVALLQRKVDELQVYKQAMLNSTSWRLTKPLRRVAEWSKSFHQASSRHLRKLLSLPSRRLEGPDLGSPNLELLRALQMRPLNPEDISHLFIDIEWSETARPCDHVASEDSRELAYGLRQLLVCDAQTKAPITGMSMNTAGASDGAVCFGFSYAEGWGRWTLGKRSRLMIAIPKDVKGRILITFSGEPFKQAFSSVKAKISANGNFISEAVFGTEDVTIEIDTASTIQTFDDALNLSLDQTAKPDISIVILDYNKPTLTKSAVIAAIQSHTQRTYEIIVIENGCTFENLNLIRSFALPIRLIRLRANRFFGEGNNIGAEFARGDRILFLNNDAFLSDHVLDALWSTLESDPSIAAAGPVLTYPDGTIQEAGAFLRPDGEAYQRGKLNSKFNLERLAPVETVDYISAACVMVRRSDFFEIGGFDLRYDPAYYEDSDLCLRLAALGRRTVLVRDAKVMHIENATTSDPANRAIATNIVDRHKRIFLSRWSNWLADRKPTNLPAVYKTPVALVVDAIEARNTDEVINAVYSPFPLSQGGGERYILGAALALRERLPTAFVSPDEYSTLRLNTLLHELGYPAGQLFTQTERHWRKRETDTSVVMGNELLPTRRAEGRRRFYHCQFPFPVDVSPQQLAEHAANLRSYHGVVLNSEFTRQSYEKQLIKLGLPAPPVHVISPPVRLLTGPDGPKEPLILSVGRFHPDGHSKRQDVVLAGFRQALRQYSALSGWRLVLAGVVPNEPRAIAYYDKLRKEAEGMDVTLLLAPSRERIDELMRSAAVYVSATGFGVKDDRDDHLCEHFGITVVEAASAGCVPVVYARGGPADLVKGFGAGRQFDSIPTLADALAEAATDNASPTQRDLLRSKSEAFSEDVFITRWKALVDAA